MKVFFTLDTLFTRDVYPKFIFIFFPEIVTVMINW